MHLYRIRLSLLTQLPNDTHSHYDVAYTRRSLMDYTLRRSARGALNFRMTFCELSWIIIVNYDIAMSNLMYLHGCNQQFQNTRTLLYCTHKKRYMCQNTTSTFLPTVQVSNNTTIQKQYFSTTNCIKWNIRRITTTVRLYHQRETSMFMCVRKAYCVLCTVCRARHTVHTTAWNTFTNTGEHLTTYLYWISAQNCNFSKVRHRLPDDGPNGRKYVGAIMRYFNCIF